LAHCGLREWFVGRVNPFAALEHHSHSYCRSCEASEQVIVLRWFTASERYNPPLPNDGKWLKSLVVVIDFDFLSTLWRNVDRILGKDLTYMNSTDGGLSISPSSGSDAQNQ
jgi:hypothetical protein